MATQMTQQEERQHPTPASQLLKYFEDDTALPSQLRDINDTCLEMARSMVVRLPVGTETIFGLRKLLEARECFLRAALD